MDYTLRKHKTGAVMEVRQDACELPPEWRDRSTVGDRDISTTGDRDISTTGDKDISLSTNVLDILTP